VVPRIKLHVASCGRTHHPTARNGSSDTSCFDLLRWESGTLISGTGIWDANAA
jgi:hypothetical protein